MVDSPPDPAKIATCPAATSVSVSSLPHRRSNSSRWSALPRLAPLGAPREAPRHPPLPRPHRTCRSREHPPRIGGNLGQQIAKAHSSGLLRQTTRFSIPSPTALPESTKHACQQSYQTCKQRIKHAPGRTCRSSGLRFLGMLRNPTSSTQYLKWDQIRTQHRRTCATSARPRIQKSKKKKKNTKRKGGVTALETALPSTVTALVESRESKMISKSFHDSAPQVELVEPGRRDAEPVVDAGHRATQRLLRTLVPAGAYSSETKRPCKHQARPSAPLQPPPLPTNKPPKKYHHKTSQNNRITPTSPALITHRFRRSSCCSARSSRRRYRRARTRRRRSTSCTTLARTSAGCQTRSRSSPGAAGAPKLPLGAKKEKGVCGQVSGSWVSGCV